MVGTQIPYRKEASGLGPQAHRQFPGWNRDSLPRTSISRKAKSVAGSKMAKWPLATVFHHDPAKQAQAFVHRDLNICQCRHDGGLCGRDCQCAAGREHSVGRSIFRCKWVAAHPRRRLRGLARQGCYGVIIGTAAVRTPRWCANAALEFPPCCGGVERPRATERSQLRRLGGELGNSTPSIARAFEDAGGSAIIYTDIARDGLLKGLNLDAPIHWRRRFSITRHCLGRPCLDHDVKAMLEPTRGNSPAHMRDARSMWGGLIAGRRCDYAWRGPHRQDVRVSRPGGRAQLLYCATRRQLPACARMFAEKQRRKFAVEVKDDCINC